MADANSMPSQTSASMVCHVCMEVYRSPKFLACFHTFCAQCIQDWADQNRNGRKSSTFTCPVCRKQTSLPRGGANNLQTNFYFSERDLERARAGELCLLHDNREMELFCLPCKQVICLKCKVLQHEAHLALEVGEAVRLNKNELTEGRELVELHMKVLEGLIGPMEAHQQMNERQLDDAKRMTHRASNAVVSFIVTCLQFCYNFLTKGLDMNLQYLRAYQQETKALYNQLMEAARIEDVQKMFKMAEELDSGQGRQESVHNITRKYSKKNAVSLEKKYSTYGTATFFHFGGFLMACFVFIFAILAGLVFVPVRIRHDSNDKLVILQKTWHSMFNREQFKCAEERDTEVYSLCVTNDNVSLSYAQRALKEDAASRAFTQTGEALVMFDKARGKVSWGRAGHMCRYYEDSNVFLSKSKPLFKLSARHSNPSSSGQAGITRVSSFKLRRNTPELLPSTEDFLFAVNVQDHRAFDADATGEYFVILEEGQAPDLQRTVKVFRKPDPDPIATYIPPDTPFQPADVCFFTFMDEQLLLVADEWNKVIHVAALEQPTIRFLGYLESGCPKSKAPTALTVDAEGNIWVACQGGSIVKIEVPRFSQLFKMIYVIVQDTGNFLRDAVKKLFT